MPFTSSIVTFPGSSSFTARERQYVLAAPETDGTHP
jgi:hypothetical protein